MTEKRWCDITVGDIVDGLLVTDVENNDYDMVFEFKYPDGKAWTFWVVYPCDFEKRAHFLKDERAKELERQREECVQQELF